LRHQRCVVQSTALSQPASSESSRAVDRTVPPDYDLSYRDDFWRGREYEDQADRLALRALLPPAGDDLLDLGAGFGRLTDEFNGHRRVTLLDASPGMLAAAGERFGTEPRIRLLLADAAALPFPNASFDTIVAVRLLVHLPDPRPVFDEVRRLLRPSGSFILEFPNRRHALAVARHLARRQSWSPSEAAPHEYLEGHFAHQPAHLRRQLAEAGLIVDRVRAASLFRSNWLKRHLGTATLARFEARLQGPLGPLYLSPSVYFRTRPGDRTTITSGRLGD